jgi:hypothetical protein
MDAASEGMENGPNQENERDFQHSTLENHVSAASLLPNPSQPNISL